MRISDWSSDVCSSDLSENCRGPCATSHDALGGICLSRRPFNLSNAIWRCEFEDYRPSNGPSPPVGPPTLGKRKWRSLRLPGDQLPSLYGKVTALSPTAPLWTQDQAIAYEAALEDRKSTREWCRGRGGQYV